MLSIRVPWWPARGGVAGIYGVVATWFEVIGPQVPLDLVVRCTLRESRARLPELASVLSRRFWCRVSIPTHSDVSTLVGISLPPRRVRRSGKSWFGGGPDWLPSMVASIDWSGPTDRYCWGSDLAQLRVGSYPHQVRLGAVFDRTPEELEAPETDTLKEGKLHTSVRMQVLRSRCIRTTRTFPMYTQIGG